MEADELGESVSMHSTTIITKSGQNENKVIHGSILNSSDRSQNVCLLSRRNRVCGNHDVAIKDEGWDWNNSFYNRV